MGSSYLRAGRYDEARDWLTSAARIRKSVGDTRGVALSQIRLGEVDTACGQFEHAIGHFQQARTTLLGVADPHDAARALAFLGRAMLLSAGGYDGEQHLQAAGEEFQAIGSLPWAGRTAEWLADAAHKRGDTKTCRTRLTYALAFYDAADCAPNVARGAQAIASLPASAHNQ